LSAESRRRKFLSLDPADTHKEAPVNGTNKLFAFIFEYLYWAWKTFCFYSIFLSRMITFGAQRP
jgi:hypothetical protein